MIKKPLTTGEIAQYCQVTSRTVSQWINEGKLQAYQTPGKHSRVSHENFLNFLKKYHMPIPEVLRNNQDKQSILIVDDDKAMVKAIKRTLILENKYEIETAEDGFIAGQKFNANKPDLVILDIRMPRVNGFQLCSAIREDPKNNHVKILIISGIIHSEDAVKIFDLGANDYLSKPFDNKMLIAKVNKLLRKHS